MGEWSALSRDHVARKPVGAICKILTSRVCRAGKLRQRPAGFGRGTRSCGSDLLAHSRGLLFTLIKVLVRAFGTVLARLHRPQGRWRCRSQRPSAFRAPEVWHKIRTSARSARRGLRRSTDRLVGEESQTHRRQSGMKYPNRGWSLRWREPHCAESRRPTACPYVSLARLNLRRSKRSIENEDP